MRTQALRQVRKVGHGYPRPGGHDSQTLRHRVVEGLAHVSMLLMGSSMRLLRVKTPLGLFALLWALAATLHYLEAQPLAGLPLYPFALLLFLYPERLWALTSFACAHAVLLALLVNGCLLMVLSSC
jgi:hypothetical protein